MPTKPREPVEKTCEHCRSTFLTKHPSRARFCPGSKCRSKAWDESHRVRSVEEVGREALRDYWRTMQRRSRAARKEAGA
jgi:hypothetical protein